MGTVVRRNERSWAIVIISEIRAMLSDLNIKIKSVGGESTLSVNKKSMFPDVLLYEDEAQNKILQGWELKMPDVLITNENLIKDATRKAEALGLNSFVIWNFTYGKLYVKNSQGEFEEAQVWSGTDHIVTRDDVTTYKEEWLPVIKDIVLTVNEYLLDGKIRTASLVSTISDGITTEIIQRNKDLVAENFFIESGSNMTMERRLIVWWDVFREEYDKDENNMYLAYAKTVLLNWTNRVMFANVIKKYHNCAYLIRNIDSTSTPEDGNNIIDEIVRQGDFYNVFQRLEYNELIPEDTWIDIVDFNQFLIENKIEQVDQTLLHDILERTVSTAKREIRGQYATPYCLADLLCQITIRNWRLDCADLCAGTGTIAKAIIENKMNRVCDVGKCFQTTWIADKYAYPLQLANIAVTNVDTINIPVNMFQEDVFNVSVGDVIKIKSPIDGQEIERKIPAFGAIISNLPFVEYNKIAVDEKEYIDIYRKKIKETTGIEFTLGKTDLYNFLPFKLHELLLNEGRLGIILSNSWLGTDIGRSFFEALLYYYEMESVVMSDNGRWFQNADIVTTLLVLCKKEVSTPDKNKEIDFWLIKENLHNLQDEQKETIINSIVLHEQLDNKLTVRKKYSVGTIERITKIGMTLNTLFHNVSWVKDIQDCLIPIEKMLIVKRGERRGWNDLFYPANDAGIETEYIVPVLKNPALLKSYTARTDIVAFCCHKSKDELKSLGHMGALRWIEKFESINNKTGKPLPIALKKPVHFWYEMDDASRADFVTALNPDRRLFVAKFDERTFVDQRFTRMLMKNNSISLELVHALLNSVYGMFAIEAIGFGRGLGVLDASSTKLKNMYMINPELISESDAQRIISLFEKIKNRDVLNTKDELQDSARETFDRAVLRAIGHEALYDDIKKSLLSMQHTRHTVNVSL